MLAFSASAPLSGLALDRWGPRPVFGIGALFMAAGLGLSSRATGLTDLLLAYGIIMGIGLGITGLGPVASVIAGWTTAAKRGRAIGIAFAGTGIGSLVFVPLAYWLSTQLGWRGAYLSLALVCLVILLPLMVIGLKRPPISPASSGATSASKVAWRELLRQPVFWALMIVGFCALGPVRSLTVHQVAYMEAAGVDRGSAASLVGLAGLLTSLSFIALGWVSDRYGRLAAFSIGCIGLLGAVLALLSLRDGGAEAALLLYALCSALGEGSRSSQSTALASDVFQRQGLGMINGLMGGMFGLGAALGPWLVGRARDETGSYDGGLALIVAMALLSLLAYAYVARASRPRH